MQTIKILRISEHWALIYLHILRSASFSAFLSQLFSVFYLKVPSGQIGSTWEWYHWISLEKDSNRYGFLIFKFYSWIFEKTSKFWAGSWKNQSNLLLVQITVCIESCIPISWRTFIWWKNLPKGSSIFVLIAGCWNSLFTSRNPKNNWCLFRIFGARSGGKDHGLSTYRPWSKQAGGWIHLCMKQLRTLNSIKYSRSK